MRTTVQMLEYVAEALESCGIDAVFTGGATVPLHLDSVVASQFRGTIDVDCVIEAATYRDYHHEAAKLARAGFKQDLTAEVWPVCRWQRDGVLLDLMPTDESILGFSNHWYRDALRDPTTHTLPSGRVIKVFRVEYLLATKIEAFSDRGGGDLFGGHDFEDIVSLLDGCEELEDAVVASPEPLRRYIATRFQSLSEHRDLDDALEGHVARGGADRAMVVRAKVERLAGLL